jgi:hypothetical protein
MDGFDPPARTVVGDIPLLPSWRAMKQRLVTMLLAAGVAALAACAPAGRSATDAGQGGSGGVAQGGGGSSGGSGGVAADGRLPGAGGGGGIVGGQSGSDGSPAPDGGGGAAGLEPLAACTKPTIDHLGLWLASGEGTTVPATGTILVREGEGTVGKVSLVGGQWHVIPVYVENRYDASHDLSASSGFQLTYSATTDHYVQIRPASHWDGGAKYLTKIPATGGQRQTRFFPFAASSWTTLAELGQPTYPLADALKEVRGMVFVGKTPGDIVYYGLRFDGYAPACPP